MSVMPQELRPLWESWALHHKILCFVKVVELSTNYNRESKLNNENRKMAFPRGDWKTDGVYTTHENRNMQTLSLIQLHWSHWEFSFDFKSGRSGPFMVSFLCFDLEENISSVDCSILFAELLSIHKYLCMMYMLYPGRFFSSVTYIKQTNKQTRGSYHNLGTWHVLMQSTL